MKIRGLSTYRFDDNPEERRFAEAWDRINASGHILDYLLDPKHGCAGRPLPATDRESTVVATVVQWLGSPVGRSFLRELGYSGPISEKDRKASFSNLSELCKTIYEVTPPRFPHIADALKAVNRGDLFSVIKKLTAMWGAAEKLGLLTSPELFEALSGALAQALELEKTTRAP